MRAFTGLLIAAAAVAAAPASASAQGAPAPGEPLCQLRNPDLPTMLEFQRKLTPYVSKIRLVGSGQDSGGQAMDAAREVLGDQFVGYWTDNGRLRWGVAYAPGPHDAASARAAIRAKLQTQLTPAEVEYLDSVLLLLPTPYTDAELQATMVALRSVVTPESPFATYAISCSASDGFRVQIDVVDAETPELRAEVEALLAPFGDKVVVRSWGGGRVGPLGPATVGWGGPPLERDEPQPQARVQPPSARMVREHVSLPRTSRCARTVGVKVRAGKDVKRVRLAIGKRVSAGTAPRIKLKSKRSRVTVTVTLRDGSTATQTLTYRRCA